HDEVYVLNGGINAWREKNFTLSTKIEQKQPTTYEVAIRNDVLMSIEDVKDHLIERDFTLIDSRAYQRYIGEVEPTYEKAGHIPGAINFETKRVSTKNGKIKDKAALKEHFQTLNKDDKVA